LGGSGEERSKEEGREGIQTDSQFSPTVKKSRESFSANWNPFLVLLRVLLLLLLRCLPSA